MPHWLRLPCGIQRRRLRGLTPHPHHPITCLRHRPAELKGSSLLLLLPLLVCQRLHLNPHHRSRHHPLEAPAKDPLLLFPPPGNALETRLLAHSSLRQLLPLLLSMDVPGPAPRQQLCRHHSHRQRHYGHHRHHRHRHHPKILLPPSCCLCTPLRVCVFEGTLNSTPTNPTKTRC